MNTQIYKNKGLQTIEHPNLKVNIQYEPTSDPNEFHLRFRIDKKAIRDKEALHICLPFQLENPSLTYGEETLPNYPADQLAGSNKEFICVSDHLILEDKKFKITVFTPDCNLIELGSPLMKPKQLEQKSGSAKTKVFRYFICMFSIIIGTPITRSINAACLR